MQAVPELLAILGTLLLFTGALRAMGLDWRWALMPFWLALVAGFLLLLGLASSLVVYGYTGAIL